MKKLKTNTQMSFEKTLLSLAETAKTIAVIGHEKPDGDCIGSVKAMNDYINALFTQIGKKMIVDIIVDTPYANLNEVLPNVGGQPRKFSGEYDIAIALDVNQGRMGEQGNEIFNKASHTLMIDHHGTNNGEGAEYFWIRPELSSCAELIFRLLSEDTSLENFVEITALPLYVGIISDTGNFRFNSTTEQTLIAASQMLSYIDFPKIHNILGQKEYDVMKATSLAVMNSKMWEDYVISSILTQEELKKAGTDSAKVGCAPNELLSGPAKISIVFTEMTDGSFAASFRSQDENIDISQIAASLGGGGHKAAAGAKFTSNNIVETMEIVVKAIFQQKEAV